MTPPCRTARGRFAPCPSGRRARRPSAHRRVPGHYYPSRRTQRGIPPIPISWDHRIGYWVFLDPDDGREIPLSYATRDTPTASIKSRALAAWRMHKPAYRRFDLGMADFRVLR